MSISIQYLPEKQGRTGSLWIGSYNLKAGANTVAEDFLEIPAVKTLAEEGVLILPVVKEEEPVADPTPAKAKAKAPARKAKPEAKPEAEPEAKVSVELPDDMG